MIKIGKKYTQEFSYSQDEVNEFSRITGDNNPLHHSEEYCAKTIFRKPILHGMLSASVFTNILGTDLPGEGTIYMSQSLKFLKPMYPGNTYKGIVEVTSVDHEKGTCTLATRVTDKDDNETITGEAKVMNRGKISGSEQKD